MKCRTLLFLVFCFGSYQVMSQNTTEDLLRAKRVRDYLYLKPDFLGKQVFYQIDKLKEIEFNKKVKAKLLLSMSDKDEDLNIMCTYFNPFKIELQLKDTSYLDANSASLDKLMNAIGVMLVTLNGQTAGLTGKPAGATTISDLKCPELNQWKFDFASGNISQCQPDINNLPNRFFQAVVAMDNIFYSTDNSKFEKVVADELDNLLMADNLDQFKDAADKLEKDIKEKLEVRNTESDKTISNLELELKNLTLTQASGRTEPCKEFLSLTNDVFKSVITNIKAIQNKRKEIVNVFKSMLLQMRAFSKSGNSSNTVLIGSYAVDDENIREISVAFRKKDVKIENNAINSQITDEVVTAKIYLRSYRTLIPEFSTGIFYTNLSYQNYTAKENNDTVTVINGSVDKYPFIAAAHLNLIVNVFHGGIYPMLQFGVGTAQDRPSLLFGGGIRFTKPKRLAVTYGRVWTWKKELTDLKVGDIITDKSVLDKDLKYNLSSRSSLYIGIQYNF